METTQVGPLSVLYAWEAVIIAVGVSVLTTAVKRAIDVAYGGKDKRKANPWLTEVLLPLLPVLLGALAGILIPLHPAALDTYIENMQAKHITATHVHPWLVYGAWGTAVGTFSDYLYQRANGVLQSFVPALAKRPSSAGDPPPAANVPVDPQPPAA